MYPYSGSRPGRPGGSAARPWDGTLPPPDRFRAPPKNFVPHGRDAKIVRPLQAGRYRIRSGSADTPACPWAGCSVTVAAPRYAVSRLPGRDIARVLRRPGAARGTITGSAE